MVNFNDNIYFFNVHTSRLCTTTQWISSQTAQSQVLLVFSTMYGNEVLSAYGRLWTADFATDKSTVYWSDLLIGHDWSGGTWAP